MHHQDRRCAGRDSAVERVEPNSGRHRRHARMRQHHARGGGVHAHAAVGPQGPTDRHGAPRPLAHRDSLRACPRERVQRGIRAGVTALTGIPQCTGAGGKEHEHVERLVARDLVQMDRATDFGSEHRVDVSGLLPDHKSVTSHARAMKHSGQPAPGVGDPRVRRGHVVTIADVGPTIGHLRAVVAQRRHPRMISLDRFASSGQDQPYARSGRQMCGDDSAERSESTGNPVDAACLRRGCRPLRHGDFRQASHRPLVPVHDFSHAGTRHQFRRDHRGSIGPRTGDRDHARVCPWVFQVDGLEQPCQRRPLDDVDRLVSHHQHVSLARRLRQKSWPQMVGQGHEGVVRTGVCIGRRQDDHRRTGHRADNAGLHVSVRVQEHHQTFRH